MIAWPDPAFVHGDCLAGHHQPVCLHQWCSCDCHDDHKGNGPCYCRACVQVLLEERGEL